MNKPFSWALILGLLISTAAQAAITIDRTRIIYSADMKSVSINLSNDNKELPFLAQTWLEDEHYQKISSPLVALPPLQRLEPGSKSVIRVTTLPEAAALAQDRESLFYFNVREIPPKSDKMNVLQLALQTRVKLFYRPEAIVPKRGVVWQEQLTFKRNGNQLIATNPTPFYVVMTGFANDFRAKGGKDIAGFKGLMLPPLSTETITLQAPAPASFVLDYINDYGGHPELKFVCDAQQACVAKPGADKDK
ncbi:MAG: molecular chaperone [Neisseriaceae bacterium]|nr:molecular chaperone [Neisseriaceae bacterium]MBP6860748.1 molecular chaperone [Neisseriaceae bacterium]